MGGGKILCATLRREEGYKGEGGGEAYPLFLYARLQTGRIMVW